MNEPNKFEHIQPVYTQYVSAPYREDEINLVDVWIALTKYKKTFFAIAIPVFIIGVLWIFFVFNERYTLTSALQVGSFSLNSQIKQIESTESLKSKLVNILIPDVTYRWLKENPDSEKFSTIINTSKSSNVVLIQHKIKNSQVDQFTQIQHTITETVIENHNKKIKLYQADLLAKLKLEQVKLNELMNEQTLNLLLEKEKLIIQIEESKLKNIQDNLTILEKGGSEGYLSSLNNQQRELVMSNEGIVIDELLKLRFERFLLDNKIRQDETINKINTSRINLNQLEKEHKEKIIRQQLAVENIKDKLGAFNKTQVVTEPVKSLKPVGLSRNLLILLIFIISGVIGFAVMLLVMFRDKVREALQESA